MYRLFLLVFLSTQVSFSSTELFYQESLEKSMDGIVIIDEVVVQSTKNEGSYAKATTGDRTFLNSRVFISFDHLTDADFSEFMHYLKEEKIVLSDGYYYDLTGVKFTIVTMQGELQMQESLEEIGSRFEVTSSIENKGFFEISLAIPGYKLPSELLLKKNKIAQDQLKVKKAERLPDVVMPPMSAEKLQELRELSPEPTKRFDAEESARPEKRQTLSDLLNGRSNSDSEEELIEPTRESLCSKIFK